MQLTAQDLIANARNGDKSACNALIELFYERVYAFLRRLTNTDADAEDLTQRSFTRIWQSLPTFNGRSSVSSWMHSIAYHTYVDWRRANSPSEARPQEWWAACECPQRKPDEIAASNDLARRIYGLVDHLPEELRETLHLHYYQELTLQETAAAMGVAVSTIKYRLRHALDKLEASLAPEQFQAPSRLNLETI